MSDFHDFLKHQYAYVAVGEFKPGKFDEAKQLFEQAVSTYSDGFKGAYLLQEPDTDKGIAIILWNNQEDMQANQSEAYQEILRKMNHLFATSPTAVFHEVVCNIKPPVAEGVAG